VQHPRIKQHPLGGSVALSRELGFSSRTQRRGAPGNAYACGLLKKTELRALPEPWQGEVAKFARDEVTGGYVMGRLRHAWRWGDSKLMLGYIEGVSAGACGMLQYVNQPLLMYEVVPVKFCTEHVALGHSHLNNIRMRPSNTQNEVEG
jgi:hypothetical protein